MGLNAFGAGPAIAVDVLVALFVSLGMFGLGFGAKDPTVNMATLFPIPPDAVLW